MGFVSSAKTSTISITAFLTQRGREYLINDIDRALISTFALGDPDHNYMGSGGTQPLLTGDVPDVTGDYSGCVSSVHCAITDVKSKILRGSVNKQDKRKIKFKRNEDYIGSGFTSLYENLNVTVHLDRMIKYMLLESSSDRQSGSTYDSTIKSPYADFFNEVVVVVSGATDFLERIERKEIEYKIGEQTPKDRDYFQRLFNINQTILSDPAVGIEKYPSTTVDKRDFPSPFVLNLSSFLSGETLNIGGSGKGGLLIYPRSLGYVGENTQLTTPSTSTFPIISNLKRFYREIDLENVDFDLTNPIFQNKLTKSKIIPSAVVDTGKDGIKVFEIRSEILQKPEELLGDDDQSPREIETRWRNHYLRFYNRGLIIEEIKLLSRFIEENSKQGDNNRLFDINYSGSSTITPSSFTSRKPITFIAKTNDSRDKVGTVNIKLSLDLSSGIDNNEIDFNNPLGDIHNWSGLTSTELSQPFVSYG
ncbi:hypothetical protein COB55_03990 [Candidatus Wolfebacteria bacterium]|nr:MAG: hypothetical protein COB55_03990 [Candidatus Wolfebacteria bacterium]